MSQHLLITLTAHERDSNNVTIAFTMGVTALAQGHSATIVLLSDAVHLAVRGYAGRIDIGAPFQGVQTLLEDFLQQGGALKVCKACMLHNGVPDDALAPGAHIVAAPDVVTLLMSADKTLQLN